VEIKPKASLFIAALLGGLFFVWFPVAIMIAMETFHIMMALLALFGCALSLFAVHGILNRKHNLIIINEHGITQTKGAEAHQIHVSDIELIKPHIDFSVRGIAIQLKDGQEIQFDCRHYCSVKKFIKYCQQAKLPCA
jgi:hypothetical protein